jgi:hypothetical protein
MEESGCSLKYYPRISLEGLRETTKTSVRIARLRCETTAF